MNNSKTGALIRELRLAQSMTQKDLAGQLHITDRAVSKWERGLCAPDIALLEPLAQALGCTVLELLEGQRATHSPEQTETAQMVMDYSRQEVHRQVGLARKTLLGYLTLVLLLALLICGLGLLKSGILYVAQRYPSPNGEILVTLYDRAFSDNPYGKFSFFRKGSSFIIEYPDGSHCNITYGNAPCEGLWWAPDSSKYVVSLQDGDKRWLALDWALEGHVSNLNAYLSTGVYDSELHKSGTSADVTWENDVDYQFLQWSRDSQSMLIYYSFFDRVQQLHDGYFWYNCVTGQVSGVLELEP